MSTGDLPSAEAILEKMSGGEPTLLQRWMVQYITQLMNSLGEEATERAETEGEIASLVTELWRIEADERIAELDANLALRFRELIESDLGSLVHRAEEDLGSSGIDPLMLLLALSELHRTVFVLWISLEVKAGEELDGEPLGPSSIESAQAFFAEAFPDLPVITCRDPAGSRKVLVAGLRRSLALHGGVSEALASQP